MSNCLYISPDEMKKYKKLGLSLHDITQDYLEKGMLRSPMAIKNKLDVRNNETQDLYFEKQQQDDIIRESKKHDFKTAETWLNQLSSSLGVKANIVTQQDAAAIHANKGKQYGGESAFFVDGIVYFLEGTLTPESVVHEFSHPFIKPLSPELRSSLFSSLKETPIGEEIIQEVSQLYSEAVSDDQLQEEVLVRFLTKSVLEVSSVPEVKSILDNILFHIKQVLRKLLGRKVNVSELKADTTMKQLAEMLKSGDVFELQKDMITSSDIIEYFRATDEFINSMDQLVNKDAEGVQKMINNMFDHTMAMISDIENNPDLFPFAEAFLSEYKTGVLDEMKNRLSNESMTSKGKIAHALLGTEEGKQNAEKVKERLQNLSQSLYKLEEFADVMTQELSNLKSLNSKEQIDRLIYYKKFMDSWSQIVDEFYNRSLWQGENELTKLARTLHGKFNIAKQEIKSIQTNALEDVMVELMEEPAKKAIEQFNEGIKFKKKKNAPQSVIDNMYQDFHNMTEAEYKRFKELKGQGVKTPEYTRLYDRWLVGNEFNREKARALLNGETPDSNWFNSNLESLSMNTDPAIASLQKHIQNMVSKYQVESLNFYNKFLTDLLPHIEKNGGKFQNRGTLGRSMGFKDITGRLNEQTGEVEQIEEWVFLNEWKGYRYDEVLLKAEVQAAGENYRYNNTDQAKKAYVAAQRKYQQWKNEYMHQKFTAEYYEAEDLLMKDDIGIYAKDQLDEVNDEIRVMMDDNAGGKNDLVIEGLKVKRKLLYLTHDEFGVKKTGLSLQIAERLQEYRKKRSDFFIEDEIPGAFQDAYKQFGLALESKGFEFGSEQYKAEMDKWIERNTRVVLKNSVHKNREKLLTERKDLLAKLSEENQKIFPSEQHMRLIGDETNIVKDEGNQPDGTASTSDARQKVLDAHIAIEKARELQYTKMGLTGAETKRFHELRSIYMEAGKVWHDKALEQEFSDLVKKKEEKANALGLNAMVISRIQEIDRQLSEMSSSIPTDYYKASVVGMLREGNQESLFMEFSSEMGYEYSDISEAFNEEVSEFLNSEKGKQAMEGNENLKKWVEQNHFQREDKWIPTNLWMTNVSNDPMDYKTKRLFDKNGKDLGLIQVNDQYRIPASDFYVRVVKDKYVTPEIVGKTIDNKGNYLPKEEPTNRYRNAEYYKMKEEDPDNFEFMEALKKVYLEGQEGSNNSDKTYLTYPKVQKTALENYLTGNIFTWFRRLREWWVGREDDVFEYKTAGAKFKEDQRMLEVFSPLHTQVGMPVIGKYGPSNINDVSTDILKSIPEYIASLNHKKAAQQANSYAQMMKNFTEEQKVDDREWFGNAKTLLSKSYSMNTPDNFAKKKSSNRAKTIAAMVERDLDGIAAVGKMADWRALNKVLTGMTKRSSKINFNWNPISGLVNYGQIKVTTLTHAAAQDEIGLISGAMGEAWAFKTMSLISRDIRKRGIKSLDEQIVNIFDPASGRSDMVIGDSLSRTLIGDVLDGKLAQSSRKWLELEGTLQNFGAMMYKMKVEITDENGTRKIPYIQAFEIVDGIAQTKKGVDPKYAVSFENGELKAGEGFYEHRLHMQNVIMKWNGAFAKKDAPLITRYVLAKQMLFLKKHVIPLASKQYAFAMGSFTKGELPKLKKRMNWTTGVAEYGHTVQSFKSLYNWFNTLFKTGRVFTMTSQELKSLLFAANQIILGYVVLPYLYRLLTPLGWNPDDEDEFTSPDFAAMNTRSGYFEGLFTVDQDYYGFEADGFLLNSLSFASLKLQDEYQATNWLTPQGFSDLSKQATGQSIGIVQTMKFYTDALGMLIGSKRATPQTDGGPYFFQQEGYQYGNLIELGFKWAGWNTKLIDPTETQKAYISAKQTR